MKNMIISHKTALNILRKFRINYSLGNATKINYLNEELHKINSNEKIDVLVDSFNKRGSNQKYRYHIAPNGFTMKSTFKISKNLYCVCPELLVIQLSTRLNFYNLYLLISELCGTYSINPESLEFFTNINKSTSISKINKYKDELLSNCKIIRGSRILNEVLKVARDNSASPMESRLMLKLSGPRKFGFYGIQNLEFNKPVTLSKSASLIAGQSKVIPDISNTEYKVAVEYDSAQFHENSEQGQRDKRRRDALVHDG